MRDSGRNSGGPADPGAGEGSPRPAGERGSFGAWLRTQREARSVKLQAIADASKISMRYLEALEADRFDVLPAPVFVRGFLREYARVVGLDGDEVVNYYLLAQPSRASDKASESRPTPARREHGPARRSSLVGYGVLIAALLAAFVGIAAAISWWAGRRSGDVAARPAGAAVAGRAAAPPAREPERAPAPPPLVEAVPAPAPVAARVAEPPADRLRVVLEFQQDCWVEVVLDGQRRESELKAGGETLALEASEYVSLTLGNAPAVRVEVNGQPFPLATQESRVVRDLRIDRATQVPPPAAAPGR